jgi:hypothetical protein
VKWRYVTPGYFEALGIPIRRGRAFSDADRHPGELRVILSESLARRRFGESDPVGRRIGGGWPQFVVGVAGNVRNAGLDSAPAPEFYVLRKFSRDGIPGTADPAWWRRATAIVRTTLNESAAAESLRSAIGQLDPELPLKIETMERQVDQFLVRPRFHTALLLLFAFTGLVLAAIGLFGLVSFLVAARTREIGVRIALGASPGRITKMVVSDAARWTAAGVMLGILGSASLMHLLRGLLYEMHALDLRAIAAAIATLATVAHLAAWIPARRASRIEPVRALREE